MLQRVPPQRMMAMYLTKSLIHVHLHRIPIAEVHLLASMEVVGCASVSKGLNDMRFHVMYIKFSICCDDYLRLGS